LLDAFDDHLKAISNFKPGYFDIKMPQLNGFDLYDKIKKRKIITRP